MSGMLHRDPGLWLMLHLRPPGDRSGDRRGHCSVCGNEARFVRNSWMLPAEFARSWPKGFVDRESLLCSECGSSARVRGVGDALIALYGTGGTSVAGLVEEDAFRSLRIADDTYAGLQEEARRLDVTLSDLLARLLAHWRQSKRGETDDD